MIILLSLLLLLDVCNFLFFFFNLDFIPVLFSYLQNISLHFIMHLWKYLEKLNLLTDHLHISNLILILCIFVHGFALSYFPLRWVKDPLFMPNSMKIAYFFPIIYNYLYQILLLEQLILELFSDCTPVSSTNKTDCHDIAVISLKVALNTRTITFFYKVQLSTDYEKIYTNSLSLLLLLLEQVPFCSL